MSKYHLYHISFFDSLLKGLRSNGVALDKLTQHSYIKRFNLNSPDTYLPLEVSYEFFYKVKHSQSIDCISAEFYGGFQVEDLSDYGQYLSNCPDLYSILLNGIKYDYLIQTSGKLSLKADGALCWFSMKHLDVPSAGRHTSEQINLAMILKAFQFILGPAWTPVEIHVTSPRGYWLKNLLPSLDFKLKTNCREIAVGFKTGELAVKNRGYSDRDKIAEKDLRSIEHIANHVFNSMNNSYLPTLDEFSDYFGYSKRTAIRAFAFAGTSYKELLEKYLFTRALRLLEDHTLSIDNISSILGYSHPSNFIRAFKRWSSATPCIYRQQVSSLS